MRANKGKEDMMGKKVLTILSILSLVIITIISTMLVACQSSPAKSKTAAPVASPQFSSPVAATQLSTPVKPLSAETPQSGGVLKMFSSTFPYTFGPVPVLPAPSALNVFPAIETLIGLSSVGLVPTKLATSWDVAPDGKSVIFHLRHGVKFQDGTDFNAEAVKYNLTQLLTVKPELKPITSIDIVDNYTVKLNLSSYSNALLYQMAWVDGLMESPTALQSHESDYFSTHMVGTGPFELVNFIKDDVVEYKKFAGYWDTGKPYLDGLQWKLVPDPNTAQNAFLAGQAMLWDQVLPRYLKDLVNKGYKVNSIPRTICMAIGDSANAASPFAKLQVRQAVDYAIDKKALVDTFGLGTWEVPTQPCSIRQLGYISTFQGRTFNPGKARQLLTEAGYPQGFQTTMYARNNSDNNVLVAIQANLKDAGIDAQIQLCESAKYGTLTNKGWQNAIFMSNLGISGSYVKMMQTDGPNANIDVSALLTPQYSALMAQVASAIDKDSQNKLNQQLVQLVFDEAVMVPWYIDSQNAVYQSSVHADLETITLQFWNPGNAWISK
jgi:peptide/nickel transport system substrate-binding protein